MSFEGQRVVVLGGTSGIGLAVAQAAAAQGAEVIVASSTAERVADTLKTLPANASGHIVDLSNEAAVKALFEAIGAYDHLVFTAGQPLEIMPITEASVEKAQAFFATRYWGAFAAVKYGHAGIRKGGSITLSSGTAGTRPGPGWSVMSSICAGMEGFTRALAVELAPLRVNVVAAGVVKTPLWRNMPPEAIEALYAGEEKRLPVHYVATAEDIAKGYLYLMEQPYVSGQTLYMDGGGLLA